MSLKLDSLLRFKGRLLRVEQLESRQVLSCSQAASICFAALGDYGITGPTAENVSQLVKSWDPDFIITMGDNNYPDGEAATIDANVGQYYHDFIHPYTGSYGSGASTNRFFPALGNHDWRAAGATPYLDYFTLPGNERYYRYVQGPVEFFVIDSDASEPDGITEDSLQALWLRDALADSTATWRIVYQHHSPYASGDHGSSPIRQWPLQDWGASAILAAHDHNYERIVLDGFPYFINGAGGNGLDVIVEEIEGSEVFYGDDYGAMLVEASDEYVKFQFITVDGVVVDSYTLGTPPRTVTIDRPINSDTNDAEEAKSGDVSMSSSDLELGLDQNSKQTLGLRFEGIEIPPKATIVNAYIQFTADETDGQTTSLAIRGHDTGDAPIFTNTDFGISTRKRTSTRVNWHPPAWETIGNATATERTPDISAIIQQLVNRSDWKSGNAMALTITGNGQRVAVSYDGNSSAAPRLHIEFAPAPVKVKRTIAKGNSDAEEAPDGTVRVRDTKLEMVRKSGADQLVGLRFKKLNIPQGAEIRNAWIQFAAAKGKDSAATLTLRGEAADHGSSFSDENGNISGRVLTNASVIWTPPAWTKPGERDDAQRTVDISPIIEEIVSRPGWKPGKAIVIVVSGVGKQVAYSFEGSASQAPKLRLEYLDYSGSAFASASSSATQAGLHETSPDSLGPLLPTATTSQPTASPPFTSWSDTSTGNDGYEVPLDIRRRDLLYQEIGKRYGEEDLFEHDLARNEFETIAESVAADELPGE